MKKKGSALVIAIFVLAIVSMLILSSYKEVVSRNIEIQDNIQVNYNDNIRDNGMVILEHELRTIKKYQDQRGMFFKKGSNYKKDTPSFIKLNSINYEKSNNSYKPKNGSYYAGMIINSFYDYIGKTLDTSINPGKFPWFATNLYIDDMGQISNKSNGTNTHIKWVYRKDTGGDKVENLSSLTKKENFDKVSIGGYKIKEINNLTKDKSFKKSDNFKGYNIPIDNSIVKITYEKVITVKEKDKIDKANYKGDKFSIEMTIQGKFENGDFIEDDLRENNNIIRSAKIIKIDD